MTAPRSILLAVLAFACGCSGTAGEAPDAGDAEVFIALQRDFAGFSAWNRYDLGEAQGDGVHADGVRTVYLNKKPASGSTRFPVGTIMVKTIGDGQPDAGKTFAMVKRGGGFNPGGAAGWEWYELQPGPDGSIDHQPLIVWQGIAPPAGEGYAGVSGGACNQCHQMYSDNDFVPADALQLSKF